MINSPRIQAMETSANPLMIVGIFIFVSPYFMLAFGAANRILSYVLHGLGIVMFIIGLVMYVADNM